MNLRPYQERCLADLNGWFLANPRGNPIVWACVGAGKSVMIAEFCRRALSDYAGTRILQIVPSKELIKQNLQKLFTLWPGAPAGAHSASIGRKDLGQDILYATIGSIYKKAHQLGRVDLILVDECHLIPTREVGMYRQLISELTRYNPTLRVIGWTGTPMRGNGIWLTAGDDPLFTSIAAKVTMRELLDSGFLAPLHVSPMLTQFDASGVSMHAGDYVASQLAAAIDRSELIDAACDELVRIGSARKKWLVYAVTVAHAQHVMQALLARGIDAAMVSSETPALERDRTIAALRNGTLRALVNVTVLTTGFDAPEVDLIALMRNTQSPVMYTQIAGRGMRTHPSKENCLWCDFTDTTLLLGPVDAISGKSPRPKGEAPTKYCPDCATINTASARQCVSCGHLFPEPEKAATPHHATVSTANVMSEPPPEPQWVTIDEVSYSRHHKSGKTDSLRVDYYCGLNRAASEWVCLEHEGYALKKAQAWWSARTLDAPPNTIAAALETLDTAPIKNPTRIRIGKVGKFTEIVDYEFDSTHHPKTSIVRDARVSQSNQPELHDMLSF